MLGGSSAFHQEHLSPVCVCKAGLRPDFASQQAAWGIFPLAGWQWGTDVPKTTLPCEAWTEILLEGAGNITAAWIPKAEHVQSM